MTPTPPAGAKTIRALTVLQPWASLIASGVKTVENRTWAPHGLRVGDYLAIHAGAFSGGRGGTEEHWGCALDLAEANGVLPPWDTLSPEERAALQAERRRARDAAAQGNAPGPQGVDLLRDYRCFVCSGEPVSGASARVARGAAKTFLERAVPHGAVIAVAVLADIVRAEDLRRPRGNGASPDAHSHPALRSPWFVGPFGWVLDEIVPIDPVPARGQQGLWVLDPETLATVREGYKRARRGGSAPEGGTP